MPTRRRRGALNPGDLARGPKDAVQDEVQFYLDMRTEELIFDPLVEVPFAEILP